MNTTRQQELWRQIQLLRLRERLTLREAVPFLLIRGAWHFDEAFAHLVEAVELGKLPAIVPSEPDANTRSTSLSPVGRIDPYAAMVRPVDLEAWVDALVEAPEDVPGLEEFLLAEFEAERSIDNKLAVISETQSRETIGVDNEVDATPETTQTDYDKVLAALFDSVGTSQLEQMFPANAWKRWAERAKRNGLAYARDARGRFNPYHAAKWWLEHQNPKGWDWARCCRTLAKNLPPRSRDSAYQLTGELD